MPELAIGEIKLRWAYNIYPFPAANLWNSTEWYILEIFSWRTVADSHDAFISDWLIGFCNFVAFLSKVTKVTF